MVSANADWLRISVLKNPTFLLLKMWEKGKSMSEEIIFYPLAQNHVVCGRCKFGEDVQF